MTNANPKPQPVANIYDTINLRASLGNPMAIALQQALRKPRKGNR